MWCVFWRLSHCLAHVFDRAVGCLVIVVGSCPSASWCFGRWSTGRCAFGRLTPFFDPHHCRNWDVYRPPSGGVVRSEMLPLFRYFLNAQHHAVPWKVFCRAPAKCHGGLDAPHGDGGRGCYGNCGGRSSEFLSLLDLSLQSSPSIFWRCQIIGVSGCNGGWWTLRHHSTGRTCRACSLRS